jgi:uncharacterized protein YcbK (DUF882 family)
MNISKNFTLEELTVSQEAARSGLPNKPTDEHIKNLTALCANILQPLRERVRKPIIVTSGYRSPTINRRIGGAQSSQHTKGQAADFIIPGMEVAEIVLLINRIGLPYDQLIDEFGKWVHVSYSQRNRRQVLTARYIGGEVVYKPV